MLQKKTLSHPFHSKMLMNLQIAATTNILTKTHTKFQNQCRMDSFTFKFQASKLDKACAKLRHKKRVIYRLVSFFRVIEICLISVFVWRNVTAVPQLLPINVKLDKEYFHEFLMFLSSPRTVFLIGNAIVVILFAESRLRQNTSPDNVWKPNTDVYDEYIQIKDGGTDSQVKSYKRSKSDMSRKQEKAELRRSATASSHESCKQLSLIMVEEEAGSGKGMSDDEFRDMVEAFIARQQRNFRKES